jgi:hypothetical protein
MLKPRFRLHSAPHTNLIDAKAGSTLEKSAE